MNELIVVEEVEEPTIQITSISKLKHTALWEASKRLGGQSAMARELGLHPSEFGTWVNMKGCPKFEPCHRRNQEWIDQLEKKLFELTGQLLAELFPPELRENLKFLKSDKTMERTADLKVSALQIYALQYEEQARLESPEELFEKKELAEVLNGSLDCLSQRQRIVIELRYGLGEDNQKTHTYEEIGKLLKITRERIRQLEAFSLQKMKCHDDHTGIQQWAEQDEDQNTLVGDQIL